MVGKIKRDRKFKAKRIWKMVVGLRPLCDRPKRYILGDAGQCPLTHAWTKSVSCTREQLQNVGIYGASQMERRLRRSDNRRLGESRIVR